MNNKIYMDEKIVQVNEAIEKYVDGSVDWETLHELVGEMWKPQLTDMQEFW